MDLQFRSLGINTEIRTSNRGFRAPASVRENGRTNLVIPECPRSRRIDYAMTWFRLSDVPDFFVCSRCYADHINGTKLATSFVSVQRGDGIATVCRFWVPRIVNSLWPAAVASGDISPLREYMSRRARQIMDCKGVTGATASDSVLWFRCRVAGLPEDFVICWACVEDRMRGTPFEHNFTLSASFQTHEDGIWYCDLAVTYIGRAAEAYTKANDWDNFASAVTWRMSRPQCRGLGAVLTSTRRWYCPVSCPQVFICEACYMDHIASTEIEGAFSEASADASIFMLQRVCALGHPAALVAINAAQYRKDTSVILQWGREIQSSPRCSERGIMGGKWYTLQAVSDGFNICRACMSSILPPLGLLSFFYTVERDETMMVTCDLHPSKPHAAQLLKLIIRVVDTGVFQPFIDYVRDNIAIPMPATPYDPCDKSERMMNAPWFGWDDAPICPACYVEVVVKTAPHLAQSMTWRGQKDFNNYKICSLYSSRMRNMWAEGVATRSMAEFRKFAQRRGAEWDQIMANMKAVEEQMNMQRQLSAMQSYTQASLAIMSGHSHNTSMILGLDKNGKEYGSSSLGYYSTESGAQSAQHWQNYRAALHSTPSLGGLQDVGNQEMAWRTMLE